MVPQNNIKYKFLVFKVLEYRPSDRGHEGAERVDDLLSLIPAAVK